MGLEKIEDAEAIEKRMDILWIMRKSLSRKAMMGAFMLVLCLQTAAASNMGHLSLVGCAVLVAASFFSGGVTQAGVQRPTDRGVERERRADSSLKTPLVVIDAQVRSARTGATVRGLVHQDIAISENGVRQRLFSFQALRSPLSVLIAIDMASEGSKRSSVASQVDSFVSALGACLEPGDEVGVVSVGEHPIVLLDYTGDEGLVTAALHRASENIDSLPLQINRLGVGLQETAERARHAHNPEARRVVIVISDWQRNNAYERLFPMRALKSLAESSSSLSWSNSEHLASRFSEDERPPAGKVSVAEMVGLTGGGFVNGDWKCFFERG